MYVTDFVSQVIQWKQKIKVFSYSFLYRKETPYHEPVSYTHLDVYKRQVHSGDLLLRLTSKHLFI